MKIYVAASLTIAIVGWLRRYTTALIVVAMVALATLGVGVAQALYPNPTPHSIFSEATLKINVVLDQHERHTTAR